MLPLFGVQLYTISAFDADSDDDGTKTWAIIAGIVSTVIAGVLAFMQVPTVLYRTI